VKINRKVSYLVDSTILQTYPRLRFEQTYLEVSLFLYGDLIKSILNLLTLVLYCTLSSVMLKQLAMYVVVT